MYEPEKERGTPLPVKYISSTFLSARERVRVRTNKSHESRNVFDALFTESLSHGTNTRLLDLSVYTKVYKIDGRIWEFVLTVEASTSSCRKHTTSLRGSYGSEGDEPGWLGVVEG